MTTTQTASSITQSIGTDSYPRIASWLAKKDEIIASGKPYDLVMSGWFTPEETSLIRTNSPDVILLAGLSINWVWDNPEWMTFLTTVAGYGKEEPLTVTEDMYLRKPDGSKCAFGWASETWQQEEIYAMDPRNPGWVELISSFYKNVLEQPQHDGIIVDMVMKVSWCPEAISDEEWVEATKAIMTKIQQLNTEDKLVIFNSGRDFLEIEPYREFLDGYVMENFMGTQLDVGFEEGLEAAQSSGFIVIYAVDTDDTGQQDLNKMRLGLTLSLLSDRTFFTYDFGPRDHGQAWWFKEYDVDLGKPMGNYYRVGDSYYRDFENGVVVASPNKATLVTFSKEYTDITSGATSTSFHIKDGDGRIFIKAN
jgi:hypothetical protein